MHRPRTELPAERRDDWRTIRTLLPYLWQYRVRIGIALAALGIAKLATIGVPLALKAIVDALDMRAGDAAATVTLPLFLLIGYGLLRLATSAFNELRNGVFATASQRAIRRIALRLFRHVHGLALRFHLDRQTGGLSRDIERGTQSVASLLNYLIFSILPTFFEIAVVVGILLVSYEVWFALITLVTMALYIIYTYTVTNWRIKFRVEANRLDSLANTRAIDSLINYETVKYFNNEEHEAREYDRNLRAWERESIKSQVSLAALNVGQGLIIAVGLTLVMILAGRGVVAGTMTLGDFVLVNAFLIQLYIPLNFLGTIFREVRHCLTDMQRMFSLLDVAPEISDAPGARPLRIHGAHVRFNDVSFDYSPDRPILRHVDIDIAPGSRVAVVGPSGAGKSTLARLLFRFYDVDAGSITIDGQDVREVTLDSLRSAIGIVPQDTVLFNDTIEYNIRYGRPDATFREVEEAARLAQLHDFVSRLPGGYHTRVGERGLKLSGGEKQRVGIARTLLKDPPILILDEATSALDSTSERAIQAALRRVSARRTSLVIAHRLSTIVDADRIVVLENGRVVESGTHVALLARPGRYAALWRMQSRDEEQAADAAGP